MRLRSRWSLERAMLGPATCRHLDRAIAVSVEDLVPTDHVCRHLEATAVPDVADVYLDGITYLLDMLPRSWDHGGVQP